MKIRNRLRPTDAIQRQEVLRVDDEIEIVVQDGLDLKRRRNLLRKEFKPAKQILRIRPRLLKTLDLQVSERNKSHLSDITDHERAELNILPSEENQGSLRQESESLCVHTLANNYTNVVNSLTDMTDLNDTIKMTPPNEVIVLDSDDDGAKLSKETEGNCFQNSDKVSTQVAVCTPKQSAEGTKQEQSPSSVVEVPVVKSDIPVITLEDPVHQNGSESQGPDPSPSDATQKLSNGAITEVPTETVPKAKSRKKVSRELEKLYGSLKEIPWAQNWKPKNFLARNPRKMFPKRQKVFVAKMDGLPKTNNNNLVTSVTSKVKGKVSTKSHNSATNILSIESDKKSKTDKSLVERNNMPSSLSESSFSNVKSEISRKPKTIIMKSARTNGKALSMVSTATSPVSKGKSGVVPKLSTDLAIKQYDASKMCKSKISPKRKMPLPYVLNGCPADSKQHSSACPMPSKISSVKVASFYSKDLPLPPSAQMGLSASYRKDHHMMKLSADDPKPLAAVSPKILPFSATPDCNSLPSVRTEGSLAKGVAGGGLVNSECRLGSEQLLQKQLVSVLGKETVEVKKKKLEEESPRYSVRQSECAFRYKEIAVKKHSNYIQIILVPNRTRHNGLTLEALHELREALISAKKDPTCKVLLLNSSGSIFCSGVDLTSLTAHLHLTVKISQAIRSLIETLALFSKPIVAAVNGAAVGLGVTLLTYCDVVFASEKATFFTPYARLGHIPEGAMTLVLPQVVGSLVASDMLLRDRKLTAFQASIYGLVSEVIWPSQFMESVIPRVQAMANQSGQAMESTKVLLRYHQWDKLQSTLENECRLLPKQWLSSSCQQAIKQVLDQPGGLIDL